MEIVTQYIANDGKVFDNEEACALYEQKMRFTQLSESIFFFDENFQQLSFDEEIDFDDVFVIACKTDIAAEDCYSEFSQDILPWDNYGDCRAGIWYYTDRGWKSIEDILGEAKILLDIADKVFGNYNQYLL